MQPIKRPVAAGNWKPGRAWPEGPDMIVIHITEGTAASARSWIANPAAEVSWHYLVTQAGRVEQFVDEKDTAYHAGRVDSPTAPLVRARQGVNPNNYSIGIEHEGMKDDDLTPAQRGASLELLRDICTRRRIPMDRVHIVGHREVYAKKSCPGKIDVDALVRALDRRQPPVPPAHEPLVVWSDYFKDWLLVTRIVSDTDWWFVRWSEATKDVTPRRSTSPLHAMKRRIV